MDTNSRRRENVAPGATPGPGASSIRGAFRCACPARVVLPFPPGRPGGGSSAVRRPASLPPGAGCRATGRPNLRGAPLRGPGRRPLLGRRPVLNPGGPVAPCRAAGGPGLALRAPWALAAGVFPPRRPGSPCGPGGGCCLVSRRPRLVVPGPPARRGFGAPGAAAAPRLVPGAPSARFPAWLFAPPRPLRPCALTARALFLRAHAESIPPASGLLPVAACPGDFAPPKPRQDRAKIARCARSVAFRVDAVLAFATVRPGSVRSQLRYRRCSLAA